jgi:hypothetical protein
MLGAIVIAPLAEKNPHAVALGRLGGLAKRARKATPTLRRRPLVPQAPLGPYLDYDEAATLTGYRPSYIRKLCDHKRLGYIVHTYFHGPRKRRVRRIPVSELEAMMRKRYVPPVS